MDRSSPAVTGSQVCRPFTIKRLLMNYQATAERSLDGPNGRGRQPLSSPPPQSPIRNHYHHHSTTSRSRQSATDLPPSRSTASLQIHGSDDDGVVRSVVVGFASTPLLMAMDSGACEKTDTVLEGETIACFAVGGEARLCLPQILNTVLSGYSLGQINSVCDDLHIFCSVCNTAQLDALKRLGILPSSAPSCGLITKTDAERMCSALMHGISDRGAGCGGGPVASTGLQPHRDVASSSAESFVVTHECFGKCAGIFRPEVYTTPLAAAIQCRECGCTFSTQQFVCHSHRSLENRTCHWGFDSVNWRHYLMLSKEYAERDRRRYLAALERVKDLFNAKKTSQKRSEVFHSNFVFKLFEYSYFVFKLL